MSGRAQRRRRADAKLTYLVAFGISFGFVEAAVVYYLRLLVNRATVTPAHYTVLLNLGFVTFIRPAHALLFNGRVTDVELTREAATMVMLASVACLSARRWRARVGAFLVGFACWDLAYYLFLRVVDHWPPSLMTKDVFFLIPVAWIGPVITPVIISVAMLLGGGWLFLDSSTPTPG